MPPSERSKRHYELEKKLAAELRHSSAAVRPALYARVYNELFKEIPELTHVDEQASRRYARQAFNLVRRFIHPATCFLEIGAGNGELSRLVAARVKHLYALEVSQETIASFAPPANTTIVLAQGVAIPLPSKSVDCVFSTQVLEHIHPDDALTHARQVVEVLKPGGYYICLTPHRFSGPHDVSRAFDEVATGLHLKEYTIADMLALFEAAGFAEPVLYANIRGWYVRWPLAWALALERWLGRLSVRSRRAIARLYPIRAILAITLVVKKPV